MSHESDFEAHYPVPEIPQTLQATSIERVRSHETQQIQAAIFDFDGTLSLIREGWPEIMIPMMVEFLEELNSGEPTEALTELATEFVFRLTGKQTIYQMIQLVEEIEKRGGVAREPQWYKEEYHQRLLRRIHQRRDALRSGEAPATDWLVPYSLELLANLKERGIRLYLASGTDEIYVREEAKLLGLEPYFENRIYGAVDDYRSFSKEAVIQRLLQEEVSNPAELIGFGDGYVEIENLVRHGGLAVGVASEEQKKDGSIDPWKRARLISVGAHYVIPDFRDHDELLSHLLDSEAESQ